MYARQRINQYYATVSVILAAWIGLVADSWVVFGVAAGILLVLHLMGGAIRMGGGTRSHRRNRMPFRRRYSADVR